MNLAIFWAHMGPYHFARFGAFHRLIKSAHLIELADNNTTYGWMREVEGVVNFNTLFPGCVAESVSAINIWSVLRRYILLNSIDVLFVPSFWPQYTLVAALAARSVSCRVVFMTESHERSGNNKGVALLAKRLLMKLYSSALVGGRIHIEYVEKLGLRRAKIFDGYDVIDNGYFSAESVRVCSDNVRVRNKLILPAKYILSLGRFVEKKNLATVLAAYANLVGIGKHADHALVFVGSGPVKGRLVELATEYKLRVVDRELTSASEVSSPGYGEVHFLPFAQIDTVPAFYALATAFVLASTTEEWGLVVNEAMASGCPTLVSSAVGCAPDLVEDGKTGYLFEPGDVTTLSDRMARLCGDPEHAKALGRAAQVKIADWSCERFAKNALLAAQAAMGDSVMPRPVI
jgi:1,2-diacylglycerol 3-alpha-glucosyltransferase